MKSTLKTVEIEYKNNEEFVNVVTLSLAGVNCNSLINTGAARSCISETFYDQLMLTQLLKTFHLVVMSGSGSTLCPMGIVQCSTRRAFL